MADGRGRGYFSVALHDGGWGWRCRRHLSWQWCGYSGGEYGEYVVSTSWVQLMAARRVKELSLRATVHGPDSVLSSLTIATTSSPPQMTIDNNVAAQTETPRTVAEAQQQARDLQERLRRQPKSPTSIAIRQLAKSAQLATQSAIILIEDNTLSLTTSIDSHCSI